MIGSIPAKGSSRRMNRGVSVRARAISSRRRSPPESVSATAWARCESLNRSRSPCARASRSSPRERKRLENREQILDGRQLPEDRGFLGQVSHSPARPPEHREGRDVLAVEADAARSSGATRPTTIEKVVVFPAPFGPRRPTTSPSRRRERDAVDDACVRDSTCRSLAPREAGPPPRRSRTLRLAASSRSARRPSPRPPADRPCRNVRRAPVVRFPFPSTAVAGLPSSVTASVCGRHVAFVPSPWRSLQTVLEDDGSARLGVLDGAVRRRGAGP